MSLTRLRTPVEGDTRLTEVSTADTGSAVFTNTEIKSWAKVENTADDDIITALIDEVTDEVERTYNFTIVDKTVTAKYEQFGRVVDLPFGPVKTVTSVKTIDTDAEETTLTENEDWHRVGDRIFILNIATNVLKNYTTLSGKQLEVIYTTGWSTLPKGIKVGLRKAILSAYSDREDVVEFSDVGFMPNSSRRTFKRYANF